MEKLNILSKIKHSFIEFWKYSKILKIDAFVCIASLMGCVYAIFGNEKILWVCVGALFIYSYGVVRRFGKVVEELDLLKNKIGEELGKLKEK